MFLRTLPFYNISTFYSISFPVPVLGNFTDEEINGIPTPQDNSEYPLQRDEVQSNPAKGERNHGPHSKCFFFIFMIPFFRSFCIGKEHVRIFGVLTWLTDG